MFAPNAPGDLAWSEAEMPLRFEDVAQDGRLQLASLLHGLGPTTWRKLLREPAAKQLLAGGVLPILTRVVLRGEGGPFAIDPNPRARGAYDFSHVPAEGGGAERILLGMWLEVTAPIGAVYGPPPDGAGELVSAGSVYAEHTLTRPFASPGERRVTRIEAPGFDPIPGPAATRVKPADVSTPPAGATLLDVEPRPDVCPFVFGLAHTDSNQHVNSMVYLRLFEEAALRRLVTHGRKGPHLARRAELAYVKPSFAGNEVRVVLRAYEHEGTLGAVGAFVPEGAGLDRATCFVHVAF